MAQFMDGGRGKALPHNVLDAFKYEVASELGLTDQIANLGWGNMTSNSCGRVGGRIGGRMVKVMIKFAESALANGDSAP